MHLITQPVHIPPCSILAYIFGGVGLKPLRSLFRSPRFRFLMSLVFKSLRSLSVPALRPHWPIVHSPDDT
jgi:hypothetical protein